MSLEPFEFPPVPDRNDRLTFPSRMAAFFTKLAAFPAWAQTVADECYQNATTSLTLSEIRQGLSSYFASLTGATFTGPVKVQNATQSNNPLALGQVSTANAAPVKTALNASGSAPIYACRTWVCFKGTGAVSIRKSANVSSVTDLGVGSYRVNFATALPDANWCGVTTPAGGDGANYIVRGNESGQSGRSTTEWSVVAVKNNGYTCDCSWVNVAIFD